MVETESYAKEGVTSPDRRLLNELEWLASRSSLACQASEGWR